MENIDFDRLDALVKKTGKTKAYLCRQLGRSPYYLRDARKIGTRLRQEDIELLADELDTSADYLMGISNLESKPPEPVFFRREIDNIYDGLNEAAQAELCRYGEFLLTKEDCRAAEKQSRIDYIRHYLTAAAAGYAAPIEGEDYELVERDADTPPRADFCIDISGDSMEPYIKDGERVYVQRDQSLSDFDVGIFFLDGDVYCKQYCLDYNGSVMLLSANPKREDANRYIFRHSGRTLVCFGKVLLPKKLPMPIYE